ALVVEVGLVGLVEREVPVLADAHADEVERRLAQQRLVPRGLGLGVGCVALDVVDGGGRERLLDALADPAAERRGVVGVDADVLVDVERGDVVPRDVLLAQRLDERELRVAGGDDDARVPARLDGRADRLGRPLGLGHTHLTLRGVHLHGELSGGERAGRLGHGRSSCGDRVRTARPRAGCNGTASGCGPLAPSTFTALRNTPRFHRTLEHPAFTALWNTPPSPHFLPRTAGVWPTASPTSTVRPRSTVRTRARRRPTEPPRPTVDLRERLRSRDACSAVVGPSSRRSGVA